MSDVSYKTPDQVQAMNAQEATREVKYRVTNDREYDGRYTGKTGVKVRNYQEAVELRMPDGKAAVFYWMDVEPC
jgi:hypothetical protein